MPVFLSFGKDKQGTLKHISDQVSGRGELCCPFCDCPLIAVKGQIKAEHFRHDGETCNESLNEIPQIEGWHHFHLNYPLEVVEALKKGYDPSSQSPNTFQYWNSPITKIREIYRNELLKLNDWRQVYQFTDIARVIVGSLTLVGFSDWMRSRLQGRVQALMRNVEQGLSHRAWFEIEAYRQQAILNATLYLFEYQLQNDEVIYKVGRTRRSTEERLKEAVSDIEKATDQKVAKAKVIREVATAGHVEKFVFHRYSDHKADVGDHTEYLALDDKASRKLKGEFTKLANNITPFTKEERFIVTGRWQYEEKRLAASKRGIECTIRENSKFGRPKGTTLSTDEFLNKHAKIVNALQRGHSINRTAKITGKSRSTVKRVKSALGVPLDAGSL